MSTPEALPPHYRRNFAAGLIHGIFYQASAALSSIHTVLPSLVAVLTPAASAVGLLASMQNIGRVIPQLYTAYIVDGMKRRKPLLVGIITFRVLSFALLAGLVYRYGISKPMVVLVALLTLFATFSIFGGMGSVVYADIFSRAIPARRRGRFAGSRQLFGYALAVLAGYFIKQILGNEQSFPYPLNFTIILGASAITLSIALTGFLMLKEPPTPQRRVLQKRSELWQTSWRLFKSSRSMQWLLVVQSLIMLTLSVAPFFVMHAKQDLQIPLGTVGLYLSLQMAGSAVTNILWAWLSDRFGNRSVIIGAALAVMLASSLAWLTPASLGWLYGGVFLLLGSAMSGTQVGFQNIILEMADDVARPVCVAIRNTALLPIAIAPLLVGLSTRWLSYPTIFALAASFSLAAALLGMFLMPEPRNNPDAVCTL
jgi:MFS family permease